jgi:hypothetical protein
MREVVFALGVGIEEGYSFYKAEAHLGIGEKRGDRIIGFNEDVGIFVARGKERRSGLARGALHMTLIVTHEHMIVESGALK